MASIDSPASASSVTLDTNGSIPASEEVIVKRCRKPTEVEMRRFLSSVWREANRSDNQLGRWEPGPSPQLITAGGAVDVLKDMEAASAGTPLAMGSSFLDLGCAYGLLLIAAVKMGYLMACGIDQDGEPVRWFNKHVARILNSMDLVVRVRASQKNILEWHYSMYESTHIYSFDKDFVPEVLAHILHSVSIGAQYKLQVWASAHSLTFWKHFFARHIEAGGIFADDKIYGEAHRTAMLHLLTEELSLYTTRQVALCGSGERHTIYVYSYKAV